MIYDTAWMLSVAIVTCFLQIAPTMSSVAMAADKNMYAAFFFIFYEKHQELNYICLHGNLRLQEREEIEFARDPCLYLKETFQADLY